MKNKYLRLHSIIAILSGILLSLPLSAQQTERAIWSYKAETALTVSDGNTAPLWLSANRNGRWSQRAKQAYLSAGIHWEQPLKNSWTLNAGLELEGGKNLTASFFVHQAFADLTWKALQLSVGAKEREGFPLEKDLRISSGMLVEGANARPIPQIRVGVKDFLSVPFTRQWLAFKGHLAYGWCTDGNWQEDFAAPEQTFLKNVRYHSKSLALRIGNREQLPLEMEIGLLDIAQFGGKKYQKKQDGSVELIQTFPSGLKSYWKAFFPKQESTLVNVEGNHSGSWTASLTYYGKEWKLRAYLEHYFEDHSQMFMEYGLWKDGQIGIELTLPKNPWVSKILWEGMNTTDQTGPILYDGIAGSFPEFQVSGGDNYFNNGQYLAWHHWGMGMTNPLIPGPIYNTDGSLLYRSSRVKSHHIGICGEPSKEWSYRLLLSHVRHWGTYPLPLDKVRKQFSGLLEATYAPMKLKGWSATVALATDRGNYIGNTNGTTLTIRKTGIWKE